MNHQSLHIENQSYTIKTRYESSYYQLINRNLSQNKQQIIVTFQENFVSKEYSKNFETTRKSTNQAVGKSAERALAVRPWPMLMNLRYSMSRRAGYTYVFAVSLMTSSSRFIARRATTGAKLERESICRVDLLVFLPAPQRFVRMKNIFSRLLARNIRYQCIYGMPALPYQKKKKR